MSDEKSNVASLACAEPNIEATSGVTFANKKSEMKKVEAAGEENGKESEEEELVESREVRDEDIKYTPNAVLHAEVNKFFTQAQIPKMGWSDAMIEMLLTYLASLDTNNFTKKASVGEREGRIYSGLVAKRHYHMVHGVGRSGDFTESQPKAFGSTQGSIMATSIVLQLCKTLVSKDVECAFVSPMATGMSISLVLLSLKKKYPDAEYVIWPRLDQKSCLKSILISGLVPIVVEGRINNGEIKTDTVEIERQIILHGAENILCVLSATSCFAPRAPDSLKTIAKICFRYDIPHVINNAYGLQSDEISKSIRIAKQAGRVDFFVQSTDKNLMMPVGGAIIAGFDMAAVKDVSSCYPGRATITPSIDLIITILSMGWDKFNSLRESRVAMFTYLREELTKLAMRHDEKVIETPNNPISIGMTLCHVGEKLPKDQCSKSLTRLGAMLFTRNVFGCRVVTCDEKMVIDGIELKGWGAHHSQYPTPYLTAAASIGIEKSDVDSFIKKLDKCLKTHKDKIENQLRLVYPVTGAP